MAMGGVAGHAERPERNKYESEIGKHVPAARQARDELQRLNAELRRVANSVLGSEPPTPEKPPSAGLSAIPNGLSAELQDVMGQVGQELIELAALTGRLGRLG